MSTETNPPPAATGTDGKTIAIISYFTWIGWIIAFVMHSSNKSSIGAYHIRQTLLLHILAIVIGIFRTMFLFSFFGWTILWFSWLLFIGLFVLWLLGLIAAINGKEEPMPLLGKPAQQWFAGIR